MALGILLLSITLQLLSLVLSINLAFKRRQWAWYLLSLAVMLMSLRRLNTLVQSIASNKPPDSLTESIALAISILMVLSFALLSRDFGEAPKPAGDPSNPKTGLLAKTAIVLGAVLMVASCLIIIYAYSLNRQKVIQSLVEGRMAVVHRMAYSAELTAKRAGPKKALGELETGWNGNPSSYAGSYICLVDSKGRYLLHSLDPRKVGRMVGRPKPLPGFSQESPFASGKNWSGLLTWEDGQAQLATFVYSRDLGAWLSMHSPLREVDKRLFHQNIPWLVNLLLVDLLLFPLALWLIHQAYRKSQVELARAEEATRLSERNYREIFDKANDAIFVHEMETGRVLDVNQKACDLMGYSREELTGEHPATFATGEPGFTAADASRWIGKAVTEGPQLFEWRGFPKRGPAKWVEVSLVRARIAGKDRLLAFFREIGDRKRAEEEFKTSESTYREIFEKVNDALFVHDMETGNILDVNQRTCEMMGYSRDEIIQGNVGLVSEGLPPYDQENALKWIRKAIQEGPQLFQWKCRKRNGEVFGVEVNLKRVVISGQDRLLALVRDVTERLKIEAALKANEERFRALIENAPDLISITDAKGVYLYASPSYERLLGFKSEELTGKNSSEFLHPGDLEGLGKNASILLDSPGSSLSMDIRFRHKNGSWHVLEANGKNLLDFPPIRGVVSNSRDVTEERKAAEILKDYATRLERSNRELQDFASVAAHDLQEPLRKIQAFGDRLFQKYKPQLEGDGKDYLERMQKAAKRMETLIDDLLTYSRVTSQAKPFQKIDLNLVVQEVLGDLEVLLEKTGGKVEAGTLPSLGADPTQIRQLLQNLIGNSLKFHRAGVAPVVRIDAKIVPISGKDPGAHWHEISISDNGIGFDEKYLDRIFTIFQRLHGRDEYEGTGIGLALCRKIVERHGGVITAKSKPGEGTVFTFTLPLTHAKEASRHE